MSDLVLATLLMGLHLSQMIHEKVKDLKKIKNITASVKFDGERDLQHKIV